ncbi:helix-turn-helix domain-containing protein [Robbsia sp. KACC 23696]|uniref:helix-turn-helix domain-containing protein n=1 Tax=Robbsia sp. KACC 23696 TaxID=3149231 RepID=UPI00325B4F08
MTTPQLASQDIPVYKLYGEAFAWPTLDLMHCESIPERSRLYVWEIGRHRHADLAQLLYVRQGTADLDIEGRHTRIETPSMLIVPPMCVHGFRFSENVDGYVFTLALPLLERIQQELGANHPMLLTPECYPVGPDKGYIDMLSDTLNREYQTVAPARDLLLRSLTSALIVWLGRQILQEKTPEAPRDRGQLYLSAFARLIEAQYRDHWSIQQYADRLGITTTHLNTICRRVLNLTALDVLHQRVVLEAKRSLVYTTLGINEIADLLGFSEATYFTRFFKRLTGFTPKDFRNTRSTD